MIAVSTISLMLPDVYLRRKYGSPLGRGALRCTASRLILVVVYFFASNEEKLQFENIWEHYSLFFLYFAIPVRPFTP